MPDTLRNRRYYDLVECLDDLYDKSLKGESFQNLIDFITMPENIMMAYRNIKRNTGSVTPGVDNKDIKFLEKMTPDELIRKVNNKFAWYIPKPVKRVEIPKAGDPTKKRPLGIPCIMDRLVQQCIKQILEPIAEAKFYENSFGFRPNRSAENAIAVCMHHMNHAVLHFVVSVDIKGFFENVNHQKLMQQLWSMGIQDKKLLCVIKSILKAPIVMPNNSKIIPDKGTPQGGVLSPLLANIYLNELDWWIASQWAEFPTKYKYSATTAAHQSMKKYSKLKEMRIVRYADDFKIFCRDKKIATTIMEAVKEWLCDRLKLEVSEEKSEITNLRKASTDFLGISFKLRHKTEIKVNTHVKGITRKRWVAVSHIKKNALIKIKESLLEHFRKIQFPKNDKEQAREICIYNLTVMGIHNYYCMATNICDDLQTIQKRIHSRLYNRVEGYSKKKPQNLIVTPAIRERYLKSKQMCYIRGIPMIPIGFIKHRKVFMPDRKVNEYTIEGRSRKKVVLGCSDIILRAMMRQRVFGTIEYHDNRISLFSAQHGKCAVTGIELDLSNIHCHHKTPKVQSGNDRYDNLVIVHNRIHVLIHATQEETIQAILNEFNLKYSQIDKVNKLRDLLNLPHIDRRYKTGISEN